MDIHSESRDGAGIIRLSFDYGTNTDLALSLIHIYVRCGDIYELYYCDKEWKSVGKMRAVSDSLLFCDIPKDALLLLRNHCLLYTSIAKLSRLE